MANAKTQLWKERGWTTSIPFILASVAVAALLPACHDYLSPDAAHAPFPAHASRKVQEGTVVLRDGEETRVSYPAAFATPPRLAIVGFNQSLFKEKPYEAADFEILELTAQYFKIRNNHRERDMGSWVAVSWRAEGTAAEDKPAALKTRQELLLGFVKQTGGSVSVDLKLPGAPVTGIDLHGTRTADSDLSLLEGLATLLTLNLYGTKITDAGLSHLAGLTGLQTLHLNDTAITDGGLHHLRKLNNLKELSLNHTGVTDQGLGEIGGMKALRKLVLGGSGITDRGLEQLKGLHDLKQLFLYNTRATASGIAQLQAALPKVRILH